MSLFGKIFGSAPKDAGAMIQADVMRLVARACRQNREAVPPGATEEQIDELATRTGIAIPEELRTRLRAFGGFETEGGYSLLGVGDPTKWGNIDAYLDGTPEWRERGWIPITSDGCGNHDVLDTTTVVGDTHPVYFVDHEVGIEEANHMVASGVWPFLKGLLTRELDPDWPEEDKPFWPHDKALTLKIDPDLARYDGNVPLPWQK